MKREEMGLNFGNDNMEDVMKMAVKKAAQYDYADLSIKSTKKPRYESEENPFFHPDPFIRRIYRRAILNDPML